MPLRMFVLNRLGAPLLKSSVEEVGEQVIDADALSTLIIHVFQSVTESIELIISFIKATQLMDREHRCL